MDRKNWGQGCENTGAGRASPDPRTQNAPFLLLRPSLYLKQSLNPVSFYYNHIAIALLVPEKLEALALTLLILSFTPQ